MAVDYLAILKWQPTKDAANGKNFPKPLLRPGQEPPPEDNNADGKTFGTKGMTNVDVDAVLAKFYAGGDDVSQSSSEPRTSPSSRPRKASKRTSRGNSRQSPQPPQRKEPKPEKPSAGT